MLLYLLLSKFFISIYLWYLFDSATSEFQFVEDRIWLKVLLIIKLELMEFQFYLLFLTTFITPLCIISVNKLLKKIKRIFNSNFNNGNFNDWSFLFFRFSNFLFIF